MELDDVQLQLDKISRMREQLRQALVYAEVTPAEYIRLSSELDREQLRVTDKLLDPVKHN